MKIKIRIAVAANRDGQWNAYGYQSHEEPASWDETMDAFEQLANEHRFWVEAEIEVPDEQIVQASSVTSTMSQDQPK